MEKLIDLLTYVLFHFTVYSSKNFLRSPLSSIHLKLNKIFFKRFYKSYSKYLDIHIQLYSLCFLIYHVLIQKNELASDKYSRSEYFSNNLVFNLAPIKMYCWSLLVVDFGSV